MRDLRHLGRVFWVLLAFGAIGISTSGFSNRYNEADKKILSGSINASAYMLKYFNSIRLKDFQSDTGKTKVLLIGDGSDELCSGYMYFHNAPSPADSHLENIKLLKEIYLYDVLRADRGIASN